MSAEAQNEGGDVRPLFVAGSQYYLNRTDRLTADIWGNRK